MFLACEKGFPICIDLADEAATVALAGRLAATAHIGDVLALEGDLGAGKTTFARAFIQALAEGPEEVPSPTFTLAQAYQTPRGTVHHFDLYRLSGGEEETAELGFDDAFAEGISLIEWPDRLGSRLPDRCLTVGLAFAAGDPGARRARLDGGGDWPERLRTARLA